MKRFRISRRTLLRGALGSFVALPLLDIMEGGAKVRADGDLPCRYVVGAVGCSLGYDRDFFVPNGMGAGYDLKRSLQPLGERSVQEHVSVVSNLKVPWASQSERPTEPGTRTTNFHGGCHAPLYTGTSSHSTATYVNEDGEVIQSTSNPSAASSEVIVGRGAGTVIPFLGYKIEDRGGSFPRALMSFDDDGTPIVPLLSPSQAYNGLIGLVGSGEEMMMPDNTARERADFLFRRRQSALDLAAEDAQRLSMRLGQEDKRRLDAHFSQLRSLESFIQSLRDRDPNEPTSSACMPIDNPGNGSGENARGRAFIDILTMAFACDLTRSASLFFSSTQSAVNLNEVTGLDDGIHKLTHAGVSGSQGSNFAERTSYNMGEIIRWHVDQFAYLVQSLATTDDGAGGKLIDHTAAVLMPEGGWGFNPQGPSGPHSTVNMACLIAGHAGGLAAGRHIRLNEAHPTKVIASAMSAVGAGDTLGEVSGAQSELFD